MGVLDNNTLLGASAGGDYEIEQSLRFDDGRGTYLSWTPSAAGNRKTWTWSGWVKRGPTGANQSIFRVNGSGDTGRTDVWFNTNDYLYLAGSSTYFRITDQLFRDPSAWGHLVIAFDTTQSTATDRVKIYWNGVQITSFSTNNTLSQNTNYGVNQASVSWDIGKGYGYLDGYLADVNFIDGQALTPDSFGETGDYGEWKPIAYAGTYGTNGFYLPFEQDYSVEGFSTVVYEGNQNSSTYIGGTGFQPDLVWGKNRSSASNHWLFDSVRGTTKMLQADQTNAEETQTGVTAFDTDGFTLGTWIGSTKTGDDYVAWNWDMGGTTASNTSGTINSSVRANQAYGQSIVKYTGTGSNATVGHGLSSAPDMIICKSDTNGYDWPVYHSALASAAHVVTLNLTSAQEVQANKFNSTAPTSSLFSVGTHGTNVGSKQQIAYCFNSVTGYSKFSSYEGTGGTHAITLGFSPAFVMIKNIDAASSWSMWDNTRNPNNPVTQMLRANTSGAEETKTDREPSFTATGFTIGDADADTNASGQTYIYMAFADTREYAYWYDQSGNNNDWTSEGGLTESDVMVDSPTNNFATLNPLSSFTGYATAVLSEGNLQASLPDNAEGKGSISVSSGKWYFEGFAKTATNNKLAFGIHKADGIFTGGTSIPNNSSAGLVWFGHSGIQGYASDSSYGTFTTGDIIGVKLDMDSKTIQFTKNGTAQGTKDFSSANFDTVVASVFSGQTSNVGVLNFGSDSSFAGSKTQQGNSDANGIGDFYYQPPSGFLSLCTKSLPSVDVIPSEHFNTVTWTGNGSARSIATGVDADLVWTKARNQSYDHNIFDSVRGALKKISSNSSNAESSMANSVTAFNTDGFTLGDTAQVNLNGGTFVAWNWKAGGNAVSNTNGSVTSQVSANVDAGISIATFTLPTTVTTIGHGLSKPPELIFQKGRVSGSAWWTFAKPVGNTKALRLDTTTNAVTSSNFWNNTDPTSTLVTIGANSGGNNSWMMYCFHSVDGYSKVGSYVGNGNANGPMVNCGFFPNFVMIKRTDSGSHWEIHDIAREPNNVKTKLLNADQSNAEDNNANSSVDFLSNGFKLRTSHAERNASGGTYIFLAFAENPFKHSNAR